MLADLSHLRGRLDVAAAFDDASIEGTALHALSKAYADIQAKVADLAALERLSRLVPAVQSLRDKVAPGAVMDADALAVLMEEAQGQDTHAGIGAACQDIDAAVARIRSIEAEAQAAAERAAAELAAAELAAAERAAAKLAAAEAAAAEVAAADRLPPHALLLPSRPLLRRPPRNSARTMSPRCTKC